MTKQSFTIPEGCKAVTVEQIGNQIITTFEPVFKRGDVLIATNNDPVENILVYDSQNGGFTTSIVSVYNNIVIVNGKYYGINYRHATPEEAQRLWDALAKEGKRWNPETMQVEPIKKERWRAEICEEYYYISSSLRTEKNYDAERVAEDVRYEKGNYFQTAEQAQRAANRLQAELDKFWEEELR